MSRRFCQRHLHWLWIPLEGFFDLGWGLHSPKGAWVGSPSPSDHEVQFKHLTIDMSPFTFFLACSYICNLFLSLAVGLIPILFVLRAFVVIIWPCLLSIFILGVSLVVLGTIILHALHQLHQVLAHLGVYQRWNTKLHAQGWSLHRKANIFESLKKKNQYKG